MNKKTPIIHTAADIAVKEGMDSLTLAHVAANAGLTKQGVLHYFPSMKALLAALVAWCDERYLETYMKKIDAQPPRPGRTPRVYVESVVETYGDGSSERDRVAAALYATATRTELAGTAYVVSYDRLRSDCHADGGDVGEALSIITTFDALCLGSALTHNLTPEDRDLIWDNLQQRLKKLEGEQ